MLLAAVLQAPAADDRTAVVVFGRDKWYQAVRGDEEVFTGLLEKSPGGGRNARTSYCLVMQVEGKPVTREVFVGEETRLLLPFVNRKVKITGMGVDLKVDQRMRYEIWPARVELDGRGGGGRDGDILARADWEAKLPQFRQIGQGQEQAVVRTPQEFAKVCNNSKDEARAILKALGVEDIDFRREMLLIVTGGVQLSTTTVEVTGIDARERSMTVTWRINKPSREPAVRKHTHPAQILVVPRFDGQVKFEQK
jgi:hypothetical protein